MPCVLARSFTTWWTVDYNMHFKVGSFMSPFPCPVPAIFSVFLLRKTASHYKSVALSQGRTRAGPEKLDVTSSCMFQIGLCPPSLLFWACYSGWLARD